MVENHLRTNRPLAILMSAAVFIIASLTFIGCSGGKFTEGADVGGAFSMKVQWPQGARALQKDEDGIARFISSDTETIYIEISGEGLQDSVITTFDKEQNEITVNDLPIGAKTALIQALDESSNILSQRKESFLIEAGKTHDSGNIALGIVIKKNGTDLAFEPSAIDFTKTAAGTVVPFQNWTDEEVMVAVTGADGITEPFSLAAVITNPDGSFVFADNLSGSFNGVNTITAKFPEQEGVESNAIQRKFMFTLDIPSSGHSYTLPLSDVAGVNHNFTVEWGDGSSSEITSYDDPDITKVYASAGEYQVKIEGVCPGFNLNWTAVEIYKSIDSWGDVGFRNLNFEGCYNLQSLPNESGRLDQVTSFNKCFSFSPNLTSIPPGLFDKNTVAANFRECFSGSGITSIPAGLFDDNTAATDFGFCFTSCENLTTIPPGLFDNNTAVTSFYDCFSYCSNLTSIPPGLFSNNTVVTTYSHCFVACASLTEIPSGIFDNGSAVENFMYCFSGCTSLTSMPSDLFDDNTAVTNFAGCFYNCSILTGAAPDLWNRNPEPNGNDCFKNCSSFGNYGSIPLDWK